MLDRSPLADLVPEGWMDRPTIDSPGSDPILDGDGPVCCSSSTVLQPWPAFSWDVNGYYRSLDVHWRASRKELGEGYRRVGGQDSRYVTYVMHQLLQPNIRRAYDRMPRGSVFLDDYVQAELRKRASQQAAQRSAEGIPTAPEDILDEEGYEILDEDPLEWSDDQARKTAWSYSYYLWHSWHDQGVDLRRWQELLVQALSSHDYQVSFAVGVFRRRPHPYVVMKIDSNWAVLVNATSELSADLADRAAVALIRDRAARREVGASRPDREDL